ncbi:MAG: Pr6Pr family membrane protein [Pseudomonadota bacterium]|jgi:hypothetical protein|nr:Pr6Pr family membrane protein [Pseudomonadota bacterium]
MASLSNRERIWQGLTALIAVLGLLLQFVWMQAQAQHVGALWMTLRYFSYFTILSNVLVAFVCGMAALEPGSRLGHWCMRAGVRGAVLLYILITAAVYHLLLAAHWHPQGLALLADALLHTVVPSLYALGWLWIVPVRGLRWRHLGAWLLVPVLYFIWAMLLGQLLHVYPYPFLNLPRLGMELLLRNAVLLLLLFALLGAALVLLDRGLLRVRGDTRR